MNNEAIGSYKNDESGQDIAINLFGESFTPAQKQAVELHYQIKADGERAAAALVDFCRGLKRMRDERLYAELGFSSFEDYAENAVGLKQRQAYTYIQVLEKLGGSVLQSTAKIGITKLQLLAEIPANQRDEVMKENDIDEMSTREMKELVEKLNAAQEQISFLTIERDKLKEEAKENEGEIEEKRLLEDRINALQSKIRELESRPVEVAVAEPDKQTVAAAAEKIVKKELKKAQEEKEKELKAAVEKAKEEAAKEYKKSIEELGREKNEAMFRLNEMEKQAKLTTSPEVMRFDFYFNELQRNMSCMLEIISEVDGQMAGRLRDAVRAILKIFEKQLEENTDEQA